MNSLLKLFSTNTLLAAIIEQLIEDGAAKGSTAAARAFTVPANVVQSICAKFGVKSATNVANVVAAFRALGDSFGNVIAAVIANKG